MGAVEFHQIDVSDRSRALRLAREWRDRHKTHVANLVAGGTLKYPPSGSDIFRPELWKPAMWRWLAAQDVR